MISLDKKAEYALKNLENSLITVKTKSIRVQRSITKFAILPLLSIPFGIGYAMFHRSKDSKIEDGENSHQKSGTQQPSLLHFFVKNLSKEISSLFVGNWLVQLLTKK